MCKPGKEVDLGQVAPADGYHAVKNNYDTKATFDVATSLEWHVSYDNQPRTRADHIAHLNELNGEVASSAKLSPDYENGTPLGRRKAPRGQAWS